MIDCKKGIYYAVQFQKDIRKRQIESVEPEWEWKRYLPGPIPYEIVETIMSIAGCWCDGWTKENVLFYTNQNHPEWLEKI